MAKQKNAGFISCKQAIAIVKQKFSYAVKFTRSRKISEVRDENGDWTYASRSFVSSRRFATSKEASHHGKRFTKIEGHKSFRVVKTKDRPNSWVNWKTGKTNPLTGRKRTKRG